MLNEVLDKVSKPEKPRWILEKEAMDMLGVKKTTMYELRVSGQIRFSQPRKKIILYDRESILQYIEKNAKDTF